MKQFLKKVLSLPFLKSLLVIIIAGFIVSILYIVLTNQSIQNIQDTQDIQENQKVQQNIENAKEERLIKLPEIFSEDYSDLESRINDLESRIDDLESRIGDLESQISDLESSLSDFRFCLRNWFSGYGVVKEEDLYHCAGKLPY